MNKTSQPAQNDASTGWNMRPGGMFAQRPDVGVDDNSNIASASSSSSRDGPMIKINISHGSSQHELRLPAQSTFRDVKKLLSQKTGLDPEKQRLFFRGREEEDDEHLHMEGVKDKSKISLLVDTASKENKHEEIRNNNDMSKASEAIAGIRADVDKLSERVAALKMAVDGGTKVSEKEFLEPTELLMRQLLKLDGIKAEGEARLQRKAEVCRVQNYVDAVDSLKARNANPFGSSGKAISVATEWETFDSETGSTKAPPSMTSSTPPSMSSSTKITQDWEQFD